MISNLILNWISKGTFKKDKYLIEEKLELY
jgi:hypothetical protein